MPDTTTISDTAIAKTPTKFNLHLIQKEMSVKGFENQISRLTSISDKILFMGDSVFNLALLNQKIVEIKNEMTVCVIDSDINARALNSNLNPQLKIITFDDFVSLTIKANKVISW